MFKKREYNKKLKALGRRKLASNPPQVLLKMLISNYQSAQKEKFKIIVLDITLLNID